MPRVVESGSFRATLRLQQIWGNDDRSRKCIIPGSQNHIWIDQYHESFNPCNNLIRSSINKYLHIEIFWQKIFLQGSFLSRRMSYNLYHNLCVYKNKFHKINVSIFREYVWSVIESRENRFVITIDLNWNTRSQWVIFL